MRNSLIEVNPTFRTKGYEPQSLKIENYSEIELQVQTDVLNEVIRLTDGQAFDQGIGNVKNFSVAEILDGHGMSLVGRSF